MILQLDGNASVSTNNDTSDITENNTIYETDDEVDPQPNPAIFYPIPDHNTQSGKPVPFDIKLTEESQPSYLPLCLVTNCRSIYNKTRNLEEMLNTLGPSVLILSFHILEKTSHLVADVPFFMIRTNL